MDVYLDQKSNSNPQTFSVNLPASGSAGLVYDLHLPARSGRQTLTFKNTGSNAIDSAFYLVRSSIDGGLGVQIITGSEFATPDGHTLIDSPGFAWPIPAGTTFQLTLDMSGAGEFQFWGASSLGTTLELEILVPETEQLGGI
jgi:hypothetical protein